MFHDPRDRLSGRTSAVVVLLVLAVLVAGLIFWWLGEREGGERQREAAKPPTSEAPVSPPSATLQAATGVVTGRVLLAMTEEGEILEPRALAEDPERPVEGMKAVRGATVTLVPAGDSERGYPRFQLTNSSGSFRFDELPAGAYEVLVDYTYGVALAFSPSEVSLAPGATEELTLWLEPRGEILGIVIDDGSGEPVARAHLETVLVNPETGQGFLFRAVSDSSGYFHIQKLPLTGYVIEVKHPDYRPGQELAEVDFGAAEGIEVRLRPAIRIRGVVTCGGVPVEDRRLSVHAGIQIAGMSLGSDGAYSLQVPVPQTYSLRLLHVGSWDVTVPEGELVVEYDIEVPDGKVTGEVVDAATGAPVRGAEVFVSPSEAAVAGLSPDYHPTPRAFRESGPQGEFELEYLPPGVVSVRIRARGYAPFELEGFTVGSHSSPSRLTAALSAGRTLRVVVTNEEGNPLDGAMVLLEKPRGVSVSPRVISDVDDGGVVEFDDLAGDASFEVMAFHEDYAIGYATVTVGDALHRVVLERAGRLRVSVVNDRGEPIPEVAVRLRDEADRDVLSYVQYLYDAIPDRDRTDKLGRAVAMHLPPGPYTVYAERENVRSEPASFVVDSGETRELELTLPDPY